MMYVCLYMLIAWWWSLSWKFHENANFMKLRGSEVCVKQDHFTHGSCSTPGSTTWWSRPFYCEKIRSNPQPLWSILWFFSENRTFWGVFKLCFSSYFQNLLNFAIFVEFGLIMLIFTNIFWIFEGSKHAILSKNHRQGSRSGSRNRAWTKTFFWCILKVAFASKIPGPPFSFENESFLSLKFSAFSVQNGSCKGDFERKFARSARSARSAPFIIYIIL